MDPYNDISHLSNSALKATLAKYGEAVEAITSETRNIYENKLRMLSSKNQNEKGIFLNGTNKAQAVLQPKAIKAETYYGVFIPSHLLTENEDVKKVHIDKNACLSLLKRYQGSRFKGFPTYEEALCFSEYGPIVAIVPSSDKTNKDAATIVNPEKPSPFRGPKSQELVKFRKAIEKGNHDLFDEYISSNPRYLVSSGDTPAILQEGSRYNALHIACRNDQPEFCRKILTTITSLEFFQRLYPDDSCETSERRCNFLLDLYLNTPDKGFNETPLHFACKHGSLECVKYLLSYSACDKGLLNKYSQTPLDVICSRAKCPDKVLTQKIQDLFEDLFFVPVLRDWDNCHAPRIGPPWSPVAKKVQSSPSSLPSDSSQNHSPLSPLFKVKGYAGPMSPQKAEDFYSRWKKTAAPSPSRSAKAKVAALRIADHEKGLERIGRDLASQFNVGWVEYWDFLEQFLNMASMEGLQKLEQHLKRIYREVVEKQNKELSNQTITLIERLKEPGFKSPLSGGDSSLEKSLILTPHVDEIDNAVLTKSSLSSIGDLCQDLEALRLNASLSPNPSVENCTRVQKVLPTKRKHSCAPNAYSFKKKAPKLLAPLPFKSHLLSSTHDNINGNDHSEIDDSDESFSNVAAQQYNFAVQSTRISSTRLSSILNEISNSILHQVGPDICTTRILRKKLRSEVRSLRKVLTRCSLMTSSPGNRTPPDFHFVHLFLSAKTVEHLIVHVAASSSVLFFAHKTLQILTTNLATLEESSSDEEDRTDIGLISSRAEAGFPEDEERRQDLAHFRCVVHTLEKALEIGVRLIKEGKEEEATVDLGELDDCHCTWDWSSLSHKGVAPLRSHPIDVKGINDSLNNNDIKKRSPTRSGARLSRAQSFLQRLLFGNNEKNSQVVESEVKEEAEELKEAADSSFLRRLLFSKSIKEEVSVEGPNDVSQSKSEIYPVFKKTVVKQLSFDNDQEKEEVAEGTDEDDTGSYISALSSLEEDQAMGTPEEQVQVYIHGMHPTKDDLDVFVAIDGLDIHETIYPHVSQWLRLIESHSNGERRSWPSMHCRYGNRSPFPPRPIGASSPREDHLQGTQVRKNIFPSSPSPT